MTPPPRRLLALALLTWPAVARADDCETWSPNVSIAPASGEGSKKLTVSWSGLPPAACTSLSGNDTSWDGTWRLQLHRVDGAVQGGSCTSNNTSSFTPSSSTLVTELPANVTSYTDLTHRADKDFRYLLIACEDEGGANCDSWYDDNTDDGNYEGTSGDENWNCTEPERWRLLEIDSLTNTNRANADGNASAALFYPGGGFEDGATDLNHYLGFWWSSGGTSASSASKTDIVYYKRADDAGPWDWNTYTNWEHDPTTVAEETGGTNDFSQLSHPWVVAASDATNGNHVEMWVRRDPSPDGHTVGLRSSDEPGADFELECTETAGCDADGDTCGYLDSCDYEDVSADGGGGAVVICADGTATCTELYGARHGRIMWDYHYYGPVDFESDAPRMLFTGEVDNMHCFPGSTNGDDIFMATWDPVNDLWVVEDDGGSPACPEIQIAGRHDPGVIPLPNDDFKVYVDENTSLKVIYWDESDGVWEDESSIVVVLHDNMTTVNATCINNMDTLLYAYAGTIVEMMFAQLDGDGSPCFSTGGIAYLELEN